MQVERKTLAKFHCQGSELVRFSRKAEDHDPEMAYTVRVFREHSAIVVATDPTGASEAFRELTRGTRPSDIDGRPVIGHCEYCVRPIFEGEDPWTDSEGVQLCPEHGPESGA